MGRDVTLILANQDLILSFDNQVRGSSYEI